MYSKTMTIRIYGHKIQCVVRTNLRFQMWIQETRNIL